MLWDQSLKSIHYRTLLIFQNKKNTTDLRVKTWGGGDKRHVIPPCQNMGVIHHSHLPPPPQDLRHWILPLCVFSQQKM